MEILPIIIASTALVVPLVGPPLAAWLFPAGRAGTSAGSRLAAAAGVLLGPAAATMAALNAVWLASFSGRCGGWLGETEACGFAQFVRESLFWSAMTIAMPAFAGLVLGLAVLAIRAWQAQRTPS